MHYLNIYKQEDRPLLQKGFNKLHEALNIKSHMPVEYYDGIKKLFNNQTSELFVEVISKMVLEYRGYQMPSKSVFKQTISEVKRELPQYKPKPLFADEVPASEDDKEFFARLKQKYIEEHPQEDNKSEGLKRVLDRQQSIRSRIEAGFEWCEVQRKWVKRSEAKKIKQWHFMKSKGEDFKGAL